MSTLMLSSQCESVFAKVIESLLTNNAPVENATSCEDVWIVGIICLAVFLVVLVAAFTILAWKTKEIKAKENERKAKDAKEGMDCERKQKADLVDKYLDFLKSRAKEKECALEGAQYREALEYMIELTQKGQLNEVSKETLKTIFNPSN